MSYTSVFPNGATIDSKLKSITIVVDHELSAEEMDALPKLKYEDGTESDVSVPWIVRSLPDTTDPVVTAFTGPATSSTLLVSGLAITATDNVGVTGGGYTETSTPPAASAITAFPLPTTKLFTTEGAKQLWAWVRDAAGNVSAVFAPISITIDNIGAEFTSQPTVQSVGESSITLAYGTADAEGDHYLLAATSNGTDWVTKVADETPGAGKTVSITGLTPSTEYTLLQLRITPLTGDLTPVLSSTVTGTTSSHSPSFSVQPTADNQVDGAIFSYTVADSLGHTVDIEFYNGSAWSRILSGVTVGAKTYTWSGQAAGSKSGCKFRVSDAGANAWIESSVVATFSTSFPVIASVTPASTQLTIDITAPSGETPDSYNGYHSATAGQPIGSMTQVVGISDPWVLTGLANDVARYIKVTAVEGAIESLPSVESSGTPAAAGDTWNPAAKDASITLSAGDTIATATTAAWKSVLSTLDFSATDGYFEIAASGDAGAIGIGNASAVTNNYLGSTANGVMYTPLDDKIYYNGSSVASGIGGTHGAARLTCAWQASTGKVWFGFNAAPNVGGAHHGTLAGTVYAAGSLVTNGGTLELKDVSGEWLYANPWG